VARSSIFLSGRPRSRRETVTPEEVVEKAKARLQLLEGAKSNLDSYEYFRQEAEASPERARRGEFLDHASGARYSFNHSMLEVLRALDELCLASTEQQWSEIRSNIENACVVDDSGRHAHQRALSVIESAIGEWKLVAADPSRYPPTRPSGQAATQNDALAEEVAKLTGLLDALRADVDAILKKDRWSRQDMIKVAGVAVAFLGVLAGAGFLRACTNGPESTHDARSDIEARPGQKLFNPDGSTKAAASASAVGHMHSPPVNVGTEPNCSKLPAYKAIGCTEGTKQPNTMIAHVHLPSHPRGEEDIEKERRRLARALKQHDQSESWSQHLKTQKREDEIRLVVTGVDPKRADELCSWLDKCDADINRIDMEFRVCTSGTATVGSRRPA
jgi:hypothetical protein